MFLAEGVCDLAARKETTSVESQEMNEIREMFQTLSKRLDTISSSLKSCQSRCHVDNPPGKWRGLGRALMALVKF